MRSWLIPKEVLESACKIIANVPPRNGVKASEYIRITAASKDGAYLTLSSDVMARALIRTGDKFPFKEAIYLDRRLFFPFLEAGKESRTSVYKFIQKPNGTIIIKHGSRRAVYEKLKEVSGYEDVPVMEKARTATLEKRWINLVDAARDCATDDPITPAFNCVYLNPTSEHLEVFASNTRVVFRGVTAKEKSISTSIAFPLMLIDSLRLDNASKLLWTSKVALVEFPKGKIWQTVKIAARKNFPVEELRQTMLQASKEEVVLAVAAQTFSEIANRIAAYVAALGRDSLVFSIKMTKGSRKVIIESGQASSKFQESLSIMEPAKKDIFIEWPLEHVMPVLLYIKEDGVAKIHMDAGGRTCLTTKSVQLLIARPEKEVAKPKPKKKEKK